MALRQRLAVGAVQQRQVRVQRRLGPERLQHQQLARGVGEVVLAAHDVRDPHVGVVDGDREVVERRAIGAGDHEVVEQPVLEGGLAADHVPHDGLALVGHAQPHGRALASLRHRRAAIAGPARRLLGRASPPRRPPCPSRRRRSRAAARAARRSAPSARSGGSGPSSQSRPSHSQRRPGSARRLVGRALAVGVLEAQHERVARATCAPAASCRVPSARRRCGGTPSGWART